MTTSTLSTPAGLVGSQQRNQQSQNQIQNNINQQRERTESAKASQAGPLNTVAQLGRTIGGIAQGAAKALGGILSVGYSGADLGTGAYNKLNETLGRGQGPTLTVQNSPSQAIMDKASQANTSIQKWTDSWVPQPAPGAAQFTAKVGDALGEAIPAVGAALVGGANPLVGTVGSRLIGSANAYSTELLEGSGSKPNAWLAGATEYAAEAIGGATFNKLAGAIPNKAVGWATDALGEGLEENISGGLQSLLTGQRYSPKEARQDFALGATVGGLVGGINAGAQGIQEQRIGRAVNAITEQNAKADIADVRSLLDAAQSPGAPALAKVIAADSLATIQMQTNNPLYSNLKTTNIPQSVAERFNLQPAGEGARPLSVNTVPYETIVNPTVAQWIGPQVTVETRATVNPTSQSAIETYASNPRALYQYSNDIYLRPHVDTSPGTVFDYRGQAGEFFRSSQEYGSMPASGPGYSFEGSGSYASPSTFTIDTYGPAGIQPDNPYRGTGIDRKVVGSKSPIGVVVQEAPGVRRTAAPQQHRDAPLDVVPQGEARVRYSPTNQRPTEVVHNPQDVRVAGAIFGRETVQEATPIKYAMDSTPPVTTVQTSTNTREAQVAATSEQSEEARMIRSSEELGQYVLPTMADYTGTPGTSSERNISTSTEIRAPAGTPSPEGFQSTSERYASTPTPTLGESNSEVGTTRLRETYYQTAPERPSEETYGTPSSSTLSEVPSSVGEAYPETPSTVDTPQISNNPPVAPPSLGGNPRIIQDNLTPERERGPTPSEGEPRVPGGQVTQTTSNTFVAERDDRLEPRTFGMFRGLGASGLVHETDTYNRTFGGLSSY